MFTNTTAIRPIDMEVNMAAIHWIWMAFVALSTVFAASLWTTIIAESWKANRFRRLALREALETKGTGSSLSSTACHRL